MAEPSEPPPPIIEVAVEPLSAADRAALRSALAELASVDPAFRCFVDQESGQTLLAGESEAQIDRWIDSLLQQARLNIGAAQVAYRETLGAPAEIDHTHKRIPGPWPEFASVRIAFEPGERGSGFVFASAVDEHELPVEFVAGVLQGLRSAVANGLLAGFPLTDFKATLIGGKYHDIDSTPLAFEIAARAAFRHLRERGAPLLLEPIIRVEVQTPDDYLDDVVSDLKSRRGGIEGKLVLPRWTVVTAFAPLSNMFGYAGNLSSMTQGHGHFVMRFDSYAPVEFVPPDDPLFPQAIGMRA